MTPETTYEASMDALVLSVTAFVVLAMIGMGVVGTLMAWNGQGAVMRSIGAMILAFGVVIPTTSYLWSPTGYRVTDDAFVVCRPIGDVRIALDTIQKVEPLDEFGPNYRRFGNGGLFGVYGSFRNEALGNFQLYARRNGGMVLIETSGSDPVVVSPSDRDAFITELRTRANLS